MKMNTEQQEYFSTSDLALAAVLSLWFAVEGVDRQNPRRSQFLFAQNEKVQEAVRAYWHGELKVEPQQFFNQIRVLKTRLYE